MKWVIASDIHGSLHYTRMLAERFKEEKADKLLLLGDILYHGPRNDLPKEYDPKGVSEVLGALSGKVLCVRGNCEAEVDQLMFDFPILADYAVFAAGERTVYATHGHRLEETGLASLAGDIVLFGHTHVPECTEKNGKVFINPGSVAIPKENSPYSYMVLDDKGFTWKNLKNGEAYKEYRLYR